MAAQQAAARTKPHRRKKILIAVGVVIGIIILYFAVAPPVQRLVLERQLRTGVDDAFSKAITSADAERQRKIQQLGAIIGEAPAYSAVYDVCYSDHTDAGWTIANYNYKCHISYIDFFEVNKDDGFVINRDGSSESVYRRLSTSEYPDSVSSIINRGETDYGYSTGLYLSESSVDADPQVAIDRDFLTQTVVTYAARDAYDNRRLVRQTEGRTLDPQKTYVVYVKTQEYFRQDIGCGIGTLLCGSPLGDE